MREAPSPARRGPHVVIIGVGIDVVDIAANWYMDDLPPMMFMKKAPNSHGFVNPRHIEEMWRDQFDWVYREMDYAVYAFTIHPDVAGRPQVLLMLERLIEHINGHDGVEWATFETIAEDFRARFPFEGGQRSDAFCQRQGLEAGPASERQGRGHGHEPERERQHEPRPGSGPGQKVFELSVEPGEPFLRGCMPVAREHGFGDRAGDAQRAAGGRSRGGEP